MALGLFGLLVGPAYADSCKPIPSCQPQFSLNSYDGGVRTPITDCRTNPSSSPCAWADVHAGREHFLACSLKRTGPIALCY